MLQRDDHDMVGRHSIVVQKGEDGLFTASTKGANVAPIRARTERDAIQQMTSRLDEAIKKNEVKGL